MKQIEMNHLIIRRDNRLSYDERIVDETILHQANGVLGSRGHFIEGYGEYDYPQTYINGFYNTYPFTYEENYKQFPQEGQTIVNLPDASTIDLRTEDGRINLTEMRLIALERALNMGDGTTKRVATYESRHRHKFILTEEKIVPTNHLMVISRLSVESVNYHGSLAVTSILKMPGIKPKITHDPRIAHGMTHLELKEIHVASDFGFLCAETNRTKLPVTALITHDQPMTYGIEFDQVLGKKTINLSPGESFVITKYQIYDETFCNDDAIKTFEPIIKKLRPFDAYVTDERSVKQSFWDHAYIEVDDYDLNQALLYNVYQLSSSGGKDEFRSIAAKAISGDGYEGHYFWDTEAYMHPFFTLTDHERARNLIMYRYHHLEEAKQEAVNLGASRGAKIPWRTINGNESSPYYPAGSAQIHINSDIAHAIITYYYQTKDDAFMKDYGIELLFETALFLLDWGHFHQGLFHLYGVTGPDEYTALVNDNYYTNKMAQAHFRFTHDYIMAHKLELEPLLNRIGVMAHDLDLMMDAATSMALYKDEKTGVILQDAEFMHKKEWDIDSIPKEKFPILLHHHPLHIYKHQILKQADAMVALVFHDDVDLDTYEKTLAYYLKRTTHDSSLSKCIYGIALYKVGQDALAKTYFKAVAELDLFDMKKHTAHGLHAANLGGSYLMLAYGLFGIRMNEVLVINPAKQTSISRASMRLNYLGSMVHLQLEDGKIYIESNQKITINLMGETVIIDSKCQVYRQFL